MSNIQYMYFDNSQGHYVYGVLLDATTGGTDDYTKGVLGVKYTFCPEVRGNSFIVPPSEIDLSFNEVWNGIVETDAAITDAHGPSGP